MPSDTSEGATTLAMWLAALLTTLGGCAASPAGPQVALDEGGASTGGAGGGMAGDATGMGGSSPTGAPDGEVVSCTGAFPNTTCVSSCQIAHSGSSAIQCLDGQWQCSPGGMRADQCPPDSCAASDRCCDGRTGQFQPRGCGSGGIAEACPAGSSPAMGDCVPVDAGGSACAQLDGLSCSFVGERCSSGFRCSTSCDCVEGDAGFVWQCSTLTC